MMCCMVGSMLMHQIPTDGDRPHCVSVMLSTMVQTINGGTG